MSSSHSNSSTPVASRISFSILSENSAGVFRQPIGDPKSLHGARLVTKVKYYCDCFLVGRKLNPDKMDDLFAYTEDDKVDHKRKEKQSVCYFGLFGKGGWYWKLGRVGSQDINAV